jgi:hypothetical protein
MDYIVTDIKEKTARKVFFSRFLHYVRNLHVALFGQLTASEKLRNLRLASRFSTCGS